jgi:hypothetical protein
MSKEDAFLNCDLSRSQAEQGATALSIPEPRANLIAHGGHFVNNDGANYNPVERRL